MSISDLFRKQLKFSNTTNDNNKDIHRAEKGMERGKSVNFSQPMSERDVEYEDPSGETKLEKMSVSSSAIDDIKYDPVTRVAKVRFTSGDKYYAFPNVPQEEISRWMRAPSKGHYYHTDIRGYSVPDFRG